MFWACRWVATLLRCWHADRVRSLTLIASESLGWDGPALPHISEEFLGHFAALQNLDWSDEGAVTEFLLTTERLMAGSGECITLPKTQSRTSC